MSKENGSYKHCSENSTLKRLKGVDLIQRKVNVVENYV
jgi:hypothetical protein